MSARRILGLVSLLALLVGKTLFAHPVVVDGDPADWPLQQPPAVNLGHIARDLSGAGEYVWRDAPSDERTDFPGSTNADILQVRMTMSDTHLYLLVELAGVTVSSGDGAPQIQVAMDLDNIIGSGESWLGALCDTQVHPQAAWEYLLVTRFGSGQPPAVYDTTWSDISGGMVQAVLSGNIIEVGIPTSIFPVSDANPVRFTLVALRANALDEAWDIAGSSDVLDAVTNYADPGSVLNTWAEVQDGVVDYRFELWFHLDEEGEPSPPLVINEVLADASVEPQGEWIEIFNRTGLDGFSLAGFKLGDEETPNGGEGMRAFPAGATIALDDVVVVANRGSQFFIDWGFDADFEFVNSNAVPDMLPYPLWATGSVDLANANDQVLLLDSYDTVIDVFCWGAVCWPGVTSASAAPKGRSLERPQPRPDTDNCPNDTVLRTTPTPGAVSWLLNNGDACTESIECLSDYCTGTICCERPCAETCDAGCDSDGICQPRVCPPPANVCQLEVCDAVNGCNAALGTACDDGDICTESDSCDGLGNCLGTAVTCPPPSNTCQLATCNSTTGCFAASGTTCDDGNLCTISDSCDGAGACAGAPKDCDDANPCTDDSCNPVTGECQHANNSASCDDGHPCTHSDTCAGGVCSGVGYVCDDANVCTDDICNGDGTCRFLPNIASCDDSNPCTWGDGCVEGTCTGNPYSCDDGSDCTTDACNGDGTCAFTPIGDSTPCDDQNPCSFNDACLGGICQGTLYSCSDANVCTDDICNGDGTCSFPNNNASCEDGNICTVSDYCQGGLCLAGGPRDCSDSNPCTDDTCNPASGCVHDNNSAACDDHNPCTVNDVCSLGTCAGTPLDCDDGNVCTDDSCNSANGQCQYTNNSVPCNDNNVCTENDACSEGRCLGTVISCDDSNPCTDDFCNHPIGCQHANNNAPCDDQEICTMNDNCAGGSCVGNPLDGDGDGYVADFCGGNDCDDGDRFVHPGVYEGPYGSGMCQDLVDNDCDGDSDGADSGCHQCASDSDCDDQNLCNGQESCGPAHTCLSGTPLVCDDSNPCTDDTCQPASGCSYTNNHAACDDGDPCTVGDACWQGSCAGSPKNCEDGNVCTDDSCRPSDGQCLHVNNTAACDDANPCTLNDACSAGICSGTAKECDDGNICTDDSCNPANGTCQSVSNSAACDDDDPCTLDDRCSAGACSGSPISCDDGDVCTEEYCDSADGQCHYSYSSAACDDADPCTVNDTCAFGTCAGVSKDCDDGNLCTDDSCEAASGACLHQNNSSACDDGNLCTHDDTCSGGACQGQAIDCSSVADDCNQGSCDPQSGNCRALPLPNGTACEDGDPCTLGDHCSDGKCVAGLRDRNCGETGGGGCGCAASARGQWAAWWLPAVIALLWRRRR